MSNYINLNAFLDNLYSGDDMYANRTTKEIQKARKEGRDLSGFTPEQKIKESQNEVGKSRAKGIAFRKDKKGISFSPKENNEINDTLKAKYKKESEELKERRSKNEPKTLTLQDRLKAFKRKKSDERDKELLANSNKEQEAKAEESKKRGKAILDQTKRESKVGTARTLGGAVAGGGIGLGVSHLATKKLRARIDGMKSKTPEQQEAMKKAKRKLNLIRGGSAVAGALAGGIGANYLHTKGADKRHKDKFETTHSEEDNYGDTDPIVKGMLGGAVVGAGAGGYLSNKIANRMNKKRTAAIKELESKANKSPEDMKKINQMKAKNGSLKGGFTSAGMFAGANIGAGAAAIIGNKIKKKDK